MKMLPKDVLIACFVGGLMLTGCSADKRGAATTDTKADRLTVINTACPIEPDDTFELTNRPAELVRVVNGQNIGFCCDHCTAKFDKMDEKQKGDVLKAAMANKAK